MIQSRNKYLQFMLVLLAAWAIAWGAMFVRLCRIKKSSDNMLFFFAMLPDYAVDPKSLQTSALSC